MRIILQRVKNARVWIGDNIHSEISKGLCILIGFCKEDKEEDLQKIAEKIRNLRIFEDQNNKMNLSIEQVKGEILCVSNFTLCAELKKGRRPGFDNSMEPEKAKNFFSLFVSHLRNSGVSVKTGIFGERMAIEIVNDGPATFILTEKEVSFK